jgi:ABC-2 type transport system ATP-binding protein
MIVAPAADPSGPPAMNAIEVRNLVKRYRGAPRNAVDDVSFDVADGGFFCLLGPNGAGKTSTVSILTTTLALTSGSVRIAGRDVCAEQAKVRRELGVVFQQPSLDLNLTAEENVRLHAVLYGLYPWRPSYRLMPRGYRQQVAELTDVLGLSDVLSRRAGSLSGGMRRKLELIRALMHRPRVLFLDEPTAGLDPESRRSLWAHLRQTRSRYGATVFLTTHYLEEAETADTVCVLLGGRVVEFGRPADVKQRHLCSELVVDARDPLRLRGELTAIGLRVRGSGPLRVSLDGLSVQSIVRAIESELTQLRIVEPTLEDAYLRLLGRAVP